MYTPAEKTNEQRFERPNDMSPTSRNKEMSGTQIETFNINQNFQAAALGIK